MTDHLEFGFFFRNLNLVYYSFLVSSFIFLFVSITFYSYDIETNINLTPVRKVILILIAILSLLLSSKVYRNSIDKITKTDQIPLMLHTYQVANLVKFGILELTFIVMIIFFILAKEFIALILAIILLFFIILSKPTVKKFYKEVQISPNELTLK